MAKYKSKLVIIDAVQLRWTQWREVCELLGDIISPDNPAREVDTFSSTCGEVGPKWIELTIPTLEGNMIARHGDYIVKGLKGEFYPVKPDIFEMKYEPAFVNAHAET